MSLPHQKIYFNLIYGTSISLPLPQISSLPTDKSKSQD